MEVDELENDMDNWQPDVSRTSYPPTRVQPLQSHGLAIHQMPPPSASDRCNARVKIRVYKPLVFNERGVNQSAQNTRVGGGCHWDHVLMQAFPVSWTV
jgi:hypothetical protein